MNNVPYNGFAGFLKKKFGFSVYKAVVDAGFSCPNRDGRLSKNGCIFCDERGAGPERQASILPVSQQIQTAQEFLSKRYGTKKSLVYFQPFTNTDAAIPVLKKLYSEAIDTKNVVGLVIGTRPDCISNDVLDLLEEFNKRTFLILELGLQSVHDVTLKKINRQHSFEQFENSVGRAIQRNINVGVHVILGLPGESHQDMMYTAETLSKIQLMLIKIHHLYIMKDTKMEELYREGRYSPVLLEVYVNLVVDFLEKSSPEVLVARLAGSARGEKLIAPDWTARKGLVIKKIQEEFVRRKTRQGFLFNK
ncbi:MAG: TIGR01212 family radical SAM protein [Candidatus Theseobacter exili]|nr:TIGR01212 family radical SAM protein [Candidatus Theseobacter exili]